MSSRRSNRSRSRKLNVERLCQRRLLAGHMTNPFNSLDANNDASVTAGDALVIINYMVRENNAAESEQVRAKPSIYPDTNGDLRVTASDALRVINSLGEDEHLNGTSGSEPVVRSLTIDTGSSPRIEFSGDNSIAMVSSPSPGLLDFRFNGQTERISIRQDLRIEASGHGNRILFDGAVIPDDLIINVWGDDNAVALINMSIADDFIYNGGHGTDGILLGAGSNVADNVIVRGRDGDDAFIVQNASVGNDFFFYGNDGNDVLAVDGANIADDAIVRLGDDNDSLSVKNANVHDVADVEGDSDFDVIAVDSTSVHARRLLPDEFEAEGNLLDVQQLIDGFFANLGQPVLGTGDVQITLRWIGDADLDLHVIDTEGAEISFQNPTSATGGTLDFDVVPECGEGSGSQVENVFWPVGGAPDGNYQAFVEAFDTCGSPVDYQVEIRINGVVVASDSGTLDVDDQRSPTISAAKTGTSNT